MTVVDPACGSGAYLLGMMQELIELQVRPVQRSRQDAKSLYDLKLEIIQRNLYGVDIDRLRGEHRHAADVAVAGHRL